MPIFWFKKSNGAYQLRTMNALMDLPLNWPVEVNNLEATAFCNWKSLKDGKNLRLPTEDEYIALRQLVNEDHESWSFGKIGNINLEKWFSPCPVDMHEYKGFYDILGNVWQHTCTPLYPYPNFKIHPIYEDYSTPTFDGRHLILKGGSFASNGNMTFSSCRNAFRRHFYQFSGFRYVESNNSQTLPKEVYDQTDENVEKFLFIHYTDPYSYPNEVYNEIISKFLEPEEKILVVGCSVGKMVLELSSQFKKVYGTDHSARFFQMATRILSEGEVSYRGVQISNANLKVNKENIRIYQMNPENPDPKKINGIKTLVVDGLSVKEGTIQKVLKKLVPVLKKQCNVLVINAEGVNTVSMQEMREVFPLCKLVGQRLLAISPQLAIGEVELSVYLTEG